MPEWIVPVLIAVIGGGGGATAYAVFRKAGPESEHIAVQTSSEAVLVAKGVIDTLKEELARKGAIADQALEEAKHCREQYELIRTEVVAELRQENRALRETLDALNEENEALRTRLPALEAQVAELATIREENRNLRRRLSNLERLARAGGVEIPASVEDEDIDPFDNPGKAGGG